MPFQTILVPVDFTDTSTAALTYAIELAAALGARVAIAHVYPIPVYAFGDASVITPPEVAARLADTAQTQLDALVAAHRGGPVSVSSVLANGVPWEEIGRLAKSLHADFIVMGTHGRRGIARALLGSVAENVIRTAPVPVLLVQEPRSAS